MKLVYCSANIYLLVYISHFLPIISRRHLKHTADKCTCAWEFKKPFIFCFITLRYIQAKINEQFCEVFSETNRTDISLLSMAFFLMTEYYWERLEQHILLKRVACSFFFLLQSLKVLNLKCDSKFKDSHFNS